MTKAELFKIAKPILFNTEMVQSILDGRKSCTRRVIKQRTDGILTSQCRKEHPELTDADFINRLCLAKYEVGDILYVRETFAPFTDYTPCGQIMRTYAYKADDDKYFHGITTNVSVTQWRPSIHMPKEAARLFLRVTGVRAERLQDITDERAKNEGVNNNCGVADKMAFSSVDRFIALWNSTVKKSDIDKYGWNANPWVWVYEFERTEVTE